MSAGAEPAVRAFVVKRVTLVALALGTYLVCREYGADRWAAAVVATALPFSGFTLYWDAGSWAAGLMAFAYAPWVLVELPPRAARQDQPVLGLPRREPRDHPGQPLRHARRGRHRLRAAGRGRGRPATGGGARTLLLLGVCVAAFLPLVYLPLLETAELALRSGGDLFENNGKMRPAFGDLFGLELADVRAADPRHHRPMQVPAIYFAWFLVPLLPWLRYAVLRGRAREFVGLGSPLPRSTSLLAIGPSKLWLFRWPMRQLEYFYLGAGRGLRRAAERRACARDHVRARLRRHRRTRRAPAGWPGREDPLWTSVAIGGPLALVAAHGRAAGWCTCAGRRPPDSPRC